MNSEKENLNVFPICMMCVLVNTGKSVIVLSFESPGFYESVKSKWGSAVFRNNW